MNVSFRLPYIAGLDGMRALAVLAVLCYHANFPWALGGFLGVETFFVLSGYLITSLLLGEWQASGTIDLKNFWLRRARRLLPAVWLLLLILPFLAVLVARDTLPRLEEDIPAALFYITNWVYIFREMSYFEAFGRPPLLQQLWSLAVEEQFYLLWPLMLAFLLRILKNHRSRLLGVMVFLIVISSGWMAILYSPATDPLRIYYGTDTRAAGFLVGALLAMIWTPSRMLIASGRGKLEILGWSGLITLLVLFNSLNEFRIFLYRGGFLLTAIASALLIIGASSPTTSLSKLFENRMLRWIGTRSYSIYLWHWPVFMLTRSDIDVHLPAALVRVGQLAITFSLAELSYRWIETPVRHQGFRLSVRTWQAGFKEWSVLQKVGVGAGVFSAGVLLAWQGLLPLTENGPVDFPALHSTSVSTNAPDNTVPKPSSPSTQRALGTSTPASSVMAAQDEPQTIRSTPEVTPVIDLPHVTFIGDWIMQGAIVVIHLGSNRPFDSSIFDQVMESLLAHR